MTMNFVRVVCVVAGLQACAMAQFTWELVSSGGPVERNGHAMVFDDQRGQVVLFGGTGYGGPPYGDTWLWNGSTWQPQLFVAAPPARSEHAMAYDSQRGRTVLFGGVAINGGLLGDTWEWNGAAWTSMATTGPSARSGHAMAHDNQRRRTVLFGGRVGGAFFGDTWEWDGTSWTQVATTGPMARTEHAMTYDSGRGRTVLFGGTSGDTWEWNGNTWAQVATAGPVFAGGCSMAYDSARAKTVLFSGSSASPGHDTWEWDGSAWALVSTAGPPGRLGSAMAYDNRSGQVVLFGGYSFSGFHRDTWEGHGALGFASSFGTGCGHPALSLTPVVSAPPVINTTARVSLTHVPSSVAFVSLGFSRMAFGAFPLPVSLAAFGMPGCDLLQSAEVAAQPVVFASPGTASLSLAIPNWTPLIGGHVYLQAWASAPGANQAGVIFSNGVTWHIGT